jgi:hypothetical protein
MDLRGGVMTTRQQAAQRREFVLRLTAKPGSNSTTALRALLKLALRRFGLRCTSVEEIAAKKEPAS